MTQTTSGTCSAPPCSRPVAYPAHRSASAARGPAGWTTEVTRHARKNPGLLLSTMTLGACLAMLGLLYAAYPADGDLGVLVGASLGIFSIFSVRALYVAGQPRTDRATALLIRGLAGVGSSAIAVSVLVQEGPGAADRCGAGAFWVVSLCAAGGDVVGDRLRTRSRVR